MSLALIPPTQVEDAMEYLIDTYPFESDKLVAYTDYLLTNWVEGGHPIHLWNHHESKNFRTNNNVEGYHRKLNRFLQNHPNIWKFIEFIQGEDQEMVDKFNKCVNGTLRLRARKSKDINQDLNLANLKIDYMQTDQSVDDLQEYMSKLSLFTIDFN